MIETWSAHIRIVLVEPAGPLNVGSVARVMKNMGLGHLVLVNPQCDPLAEQARQMAVHGQELLLAAKVVETLPQALVGCQRAIATTARSRASGESPDSPVVGLPWLLPEAEADPFEAALIFGPEDRGLSNQELNYAQRYVCIPANPAYPSLNLAQAVAVCCYQLRQCAIAPTAAPAVMPTTPSPPANGATLDQLEGFYQQLEALLLTVGYLYPHTAASRMEKFRRLLHRTAPTESELAMLRGILRQVNWALTQDRGQF